VLLLLGESLWAAYPSYVHNSDFSNSVDDFKRQVPRKGARHQLIGRNVLPCDREMSDADVFVTDERGRRERPFLFPWVGGHSGGGLLLPVADTWWPRIEGYGTFKVSRSAISTLSLHIIASGGKPLPTMMCRTISNLPPNGSLRASPKACSILARTVTLRRRARGRPTRQRKLVQATKRSPKSNHDPVGVS
jgi:hypothetical protein